MHLSLYNALQTQGVCSQTSRSLKERLSLEIIKCYLNMWTRSSIHSVFESNLKTNHPSGRHYTRIRYGIVSRHLKNSTCSVLQRWRVAAALVSAGTGSCSRVGVVGEGWGACQGLPGTGGPVCSLHCCHVNHSIPLGRHTGQRDFYLVSPSFCLCACTEQEAWCFGRTWMPKWKREIIGAANRLQQEEVGTLKSP